MYGNIDDNIRKYKLYPSILKIKESLELEIE